MLAATLKTPPSSGKYARPTSEAHGWVSFHSATAAIARVNILVVGRRRSPTAELTDETPFRPRRPLDVDRVASDVRPSLPYGLPNAASVVPAPFDGFCGGYYLIEGVGNFSAQSQSSTRETKPRNLRLAGCKGQQVSKPRSADTDPLLTGSVILFQGLGSAVPRSGRRHHLRFACMWILPTDNGSPISKRIQNLSCYRPKHLQSKSPVENVRIPQRHIWIKIPRPWLTTSRLQQFT